MMEYTLLVGISVGVVVLLDRILKTRILSSGSFWVFLAIMYGFKLLVNGYLTGRPIVLYGEEFQLGFRITTIPVEDFVFGFALLAASIQVWEFLKQKEKREKEIPPSGSSSTRPVAG